MAKSAIYFFAQYPKDFAMSAGLADIIREVKPELSLHLVCASEPNTAGYQWETLSSRFDTVQWVKTAMYGTWRGRFNLRGLVPALTKGFHQARKVRADMRKLQFKPGSVAFVFDGFSLNQSIFLRTVRDNPDVSSVLIAEQTDDALLSDFVLGYQESLFCNLFQRFFGTAYYDIYWLRTEGHQKTNQREYRFRNNPADFTFFGEHAFRRVTLEPGHTCWPFYLKDSARSLEHEQESVIVYGGIYEWVPLISLEPFYCRYNEILDLIRTKHKDQRLLYLVHPGQADEKQREVDRLDLRGFEIVTGISSEAIVIRDSSITTAYAVVSTALFTTACLGVRTHFLYPLFDDESIPQLLKTRLDQRWRSEIQPDMLLHSIDRWMSGAADYALKSSSQRVRDYSIKMLETVGVLAPGEVPVQDETITVVPEGRWLMPLDRRILTSSLRAVIGIPQGYSIRRRIAKPFKALGVTSKNPADRDSKSHSEHSGSSLKV